MRGLLVVAALLAFTGHAEASLRVSAAPQSLDVGLDEPVSVQILVTNTANPTGTALDRPRTVTLTRSEPPPGWTVSLAPTEFRLGPGQTGNATMTFSVAAAAEARQASITVTGILHPAGVNAVPGVGSTVDPESRAATVVKATRNDSWGRAALETVAPYAWLIALGIVAVVVAAASTLASQRRVAVRLTCQEAQINVPPGGRASFPLRVHNVTRRRDTVLLQAAMPEGWNAYLTAPQLNLAPGQQEEVPVVVVAPKHATSGQYAVDISARSTQAPRRAAVVRLRLDVDEAKRRR